MKRYADFVELHESLSAVVKSLPTLPPAMPEHLLASSRPFRESLDAYLKGLGMRPDIAGTYTFQNFFQLSDEYIESGSTAASSSSAQPNSAPRVLMSTTERPAPSPRAPTRISNAVQQTNHAPGRRSEGSIAIAGDRAYNSAGALERGNPINARPSGSARAAAYLHQFDTEPVAQPSAPSRAPAYLHQFDNEPVAKSSAPSRCPGPQPARAPSRSPGPQPARSVQPQMPLVRSASAAKVGGTWLGASAASNQDRGRVAAVNASAADAHRFTAPSEYPPPKQVAQASSTARTQGYSGMNQQAAPQTLQGGIARQVMPASSAPRPWTLDSSPSFGTLPQRTGAVAGGREPQRTAIGDRVHRQLDSVNTNASSRMPPSPVSPAVVSSPQEQPSLSSHGGGSTDDSEISSRGGSSSPNKPSRKGPKRRPWCVVCMAQPQEVAIDPCGHCCMCHTCVEAVKTCPVCRGPIQKALRIYFA